MTQKFYSIQIRFKNMDHQLDRYVLGQILARFFDLSHITDPKSAHADIKTRIPGLTGVEIAKYADPEGDPIVSHFKYRYAVTQLTFDQ